MNPGTESHPTFREAFRFWLKLGFISFGGPTGQIAIMHTELVEKRRWISEGRFLHALNYCMLLPGPEATQLAIYIGWLLHKARGGIVAGVLFILPSIVILWALSIVYVTCGSVPAIAAIFHGLKPAVLAIVAAAVIRIGRRALKNELLCAVALLAFAALVLRVPFPVVMISAALIGIAGDALWPGKFAAAPAHQASGADTSVLSDRAEMPAHAKPSLARAIRVCAVSIALWVAPILALCAWLGREHTLVREGLFCSKAAMVTFGGAYAVLPYVSQQAVERFGWLTAGQMLDGLGLAETTPGPLIMVLQFVGFLGAWNHPAPFSPPVAATLGAFITTWTTFVPCFLWIFLGAPHIEQLRGNARLSSALSAVTAAVVGVILNLAIWFARSVFVHSPHGLDWFAIVVSAIAFVGLARWKWSVPQVVLGAGALGLLFSRWH